MSGPVRRAVLLCAGRGIRLMPLTVDRPKPMVEIAGMPLLERILLGLRASGITEAVIIHGYLGEAITRHFGNGERVGLRLTYREQDELIGTAGAMLLAEELCGNEPFMLNWGDILVDPENYAVMQAKFMREEPACLLSTLWVDDPFAGGAVYIDGGRITHMVEKPPKGSAHTHWQIGGVFYFTPLIWDYLHRTRPPETGEYYITEAIDLMAQDGESVLAHPMIGERIHLKSPEDVEIAHTNPQIARWDRAVAGFLGGCEAGCGMRSAVE